MASFQNGPFIVTGASGQLGRQVIDQLIEAGAGPIIAVTRNADKLAEFRDKGVDVRQGDFNAPETLGPAIAGGKRILIISTDDLEPGKRLAAHSNAITAAREAGIDHIVYTSLASPVPESPITFSKDHQNTEKLIEQSGASYTILRNNLYTDLLLMSGPQAIDMGQLFAAAGDGRASYVTRADCARAAAAALMNATGREVLDITGPESIGQADIAALLSDIAGKDIPYVPMPAEDMVQAMIANGLPEFMARVFVSFDQATAEGYLDVASDDLETLTGKSGQSVADFLTENRAVLLRAPQ